MGCDIWGKWVYIYEPLLEEEGERRVEPALGGRPALARGVGAEHRARAPLELRAELGGAHAYVERHAAEHRLLERPKCPPWRAERTATR